MRDRRVRLAFLVLILALPLLVSAMTPADSWAGASPAFAHPNLIPVASPSGSPSMTGLIEALLVAGLLYADLQRRNLRAGGIGVGE